MNEREKWFERSFDFTLPLGRFPSLLERLRGTPARIEERTRSLSQDILTRRDNEHWSVQENVGHLLDLEPLWLRRAEQFFAGDTELVPADLTNRRTHEANHNARQLSDLLTAFRAARTQFMHLLARADDSILARTALHPRLRTSMRLIDLALFVAEHDDHHLAAIAELTVRWGHA
ncbi:MAG TPA: DinB family protein [Acidobacteriota bacterium]|nr:DinB family protein [Blastocatellia bacterium]